MSTIEAKRLGQRVVSGVTQDLKIGGIIADGSDAVIGISGGVPTAPTAPTGTNTTQIATTAFVKAKSEADSIGVGQTWQLVTRTSGVQYTNTTGKPIVFRIRITSPVNVSSYASILIDGISVIICSTNNASTAAGDTCDEIVIGAGKTYTPTYTNATVVTVWELR